MLVPLSWLKEFVDITLPVAELAERLTLAGLEVENIRYLGLPGGNDPERLVWQREKLVIGRILSVAPHPNADRLVLATVDYGAGENETVVTGAPNLFPYLEQGDVAALNLYSPFALEGAELFDGHKDGQVKMRLKGRNLRGVYNRCMLCSEKELGLSEEHEGIMLLQGSYRPGTPLQDVLGDAVLDIAIIPNIARCASIVGVAREVAALTGQSLRLPRWEGPQEGPPIAGKVLIRSEAPELNPRFVAMVIEGVQLKPSPPWLQRRLKLAGQRPINVVVDISNYVMLEMGQPNHTFDYDFLRRRADGYNGQGPIEIITRLPHPGETLTTLDGEERELAPFNILVTDPAGALSLGGIMGGLESEIGPATTNVLLEAAAWNFINIRQSMDALRLHSEASFRFSRGVHPSQALLGARRAADLMRTLAGGTVWQGVVDYYPAPVWPEPIALSAKEVNRLSGLEVTPGQVKQILESLEFEVVDKGDHLLVTSPDHRLDITGTHDLVEEVCRIYGYDRIPTTIMADTLPAQRGNDRLSWEERIKDLLVALGLQEVISYRLTTPEREARLLPPGAGIPADDRPYVTLANPISQDRVVMRHSLLSSLLEVTAANSRFQQHIALFELGTVYLASEEGVLPDECSRLAIAMSGQRSRPHWAEGGQEPPPLDFYDLKGVIEELLAALHLEEWRVEAGSHPSWRPGHSARLLLGQHFLGWLGEVHPLVVEEMGIRTAKPVLAADLDLELLLAQVPDTFHVKAITPFPPVEEDLALVVDQEVTAAEVAEAISRAGGFLLKRVALFDVYQGAQVPAGKKSLAYHLTFQAPDRTLTDRDTSRLRGRILSQLRQKLGAELRA